jgi:hypothetical protein
MRKRLGAKRWLGGDEFELLPSSNGGAPARDWSSLAAKKARVSWGKDRGGLGLIIGEVSWKRGNKIGTETHAYRSPGTSGPNSVMTCGSQPSSGDKEKKRKNRAGWAAGLLGPAALNTRRTRRADAGCG